MGFERQQTGIADLLSGALGGQQQGFQQPQTSLADLFSGVMRDTGQQQAGGGNFLSEILGGGVGGPQPIGQQSGGLFEMLQSLLGGQANKQPMQTPPQNAGGFGMQPNNPTPFVPGGFGGGFNSGKNNGIGDFGGNIQPIGGVSNPFGNLINQRFTR